VVDEGVTWGGRVVRCDAAHVDSDPSTPRLEGHHLLAGGVEQLHAARFDGPLPSGPRGGSCARTSPAAWRTAMLSLKLSFVLASSKLTHAASAISAASGCSATPSGASTMK